MTISQNDSQALATLLYLFITIEKKVTADQIAMAVDKARSTVYKYSENQIPAPAHIAKPLQELIDDPRLRDFFSQPGYHQVKKPPEQSTDAACIHNAIHKKHKALVTVTEEILKAIEDRRVTLQEKETVNKLYDLLQIISEEARAIFNKYQGQLP